MRRTVGERFWATLAIGGCVLAALAIFWPAIQYMARGQWMTGAAVALGTGLILYLIWLQRAK
jgi:hypothetical protein